LKHRIQEKDLPKTQNWVQTVKVHLNNIIMFVKNAMNIFPLNCV
jgi:hypothetical protein